jgi:uracil-DNA glycosylase family 4
VVGLAPGRTGANRTGIPFTGDDSGTFLFDGLAAAGLTRRRITNAVRCLPPGNRPGGDELRRCTPYLERELGELLRGGRRRRPVAVLALGALAHGAVLRALRLRPVDVPFGHGAEHVLAPGALLVASYHPSRLNTRTGRLTAAGFATVLGRVRAHLAS